MVWDYKKMSKIIKGAKWNFPRFEQRSPAFSASQSPPPSLSPPPFLLLLPPLSCHPARFTTSREDSKIFNPSISLFLSVVSRDDDTTTPPSGSLHLHLFMRPLPPWLPPQSRCFQLLRFWFRRAYAMSFEGGEPQEPQSPTGRRIRDFEFRNSLPRVRSASLSSAAPETVAKSAAASSTSRFRDDAQPTVKIVKGEFGYVLEDVPHLTDYLPELPVSSPSPTLWLNYDFFFLIWILGFWEACPAMCCWGCLAIINEIKSNRKRDFSQV